MKRTQDTKKATVVHNFFIFFRFFTTLEGGGKTIEKQGKLLGIK